VRRWAAVSLSVAVGLAFADASVVTLALPDLYLTFDASIEGVSWVLTSYALAVAISGLAFVVLLRRVSPVVVTAAGILLFAAASLSAGLAGSLPILIAVRAAQGVGAAAMVAGALPVLGALTAGRTGVATKWWAAAGTIGAVVGPALGGVVTQLLDWRAVFLVQAPITLVALPGVLSAWGKVPRPAASAERRRPAGAALADLGFLCTFGAGVGALFLAVLLLVVVWELPPLAGAFVVTAVPVGTLMARFVGRHVPLAARPGAGAALLAGGLATMALLPEVDTRWVAVALGLCGLGFGLLSDVLGPIAVPADSGMRTATLSSSIRHLGLVAGLLVIAPVLAGQVMAAVDAASQRATATMLDAPVSGLDKVRIALDIRDEMDAAAAGRTPDLDAVFAENGAADDPAVAQLRDDVRHDIASVVTRSFRPAFAAAAVLGALAAVPGSIAVARSRRRAGAPAHEPSRVGAGGWAVAGALAAVAVLVPVAAGPAGAADFGTVERVDPCTAAPDPFPGDGFDAMAQRMVLSGLNGAACELGVTREELVLSLDDRSGVELEWDRDTIEDALRAGVQRAIADADERDTLPGWMATALRWTVEHAPLSWFLDRLDVG
jgi:MFS family permease